MNSQKEINIILIGYGLVTFALIILIIYPLLQKIKEGSGILFSQGKELALLESETKSLERSKQVYQALGIENKLSTFFVSSEIDTGFIEFLEETAEASRLLIWISRHSFRGGEEAPWTPRGYLITCSGSFQNIARFIERLETAPYLIEIEDLKMEVKEIGEPGTTETLDATLAIKAHTRETKD